MREGAMGVGSSLIYAPGNFADTDELIALVSAAAEYDGAYISHIRSEGSRLEEGVQELIKIASITGAPAEVYHLKASGRSNWHKLSNVFDLIESARAAGLFITADMYTYPAGSTGLNATMPLWVQDGGHDAWVARLQDPEIRARVAEEMRQPTDAWENFFVDAGPDNILLIGFRNPDLRPLIGKTLQEVADERGTDPATTAMDLVVEDDSRVDAVYFLMSENNVRRKVAKPWISFGSDAGAPAAEGVFLESSRHPRTYGNFARLLGRYVRDEGIITLAEAIRRMTSLPAANIGVFLRGELREGFFADIVVFDPDRIRDNATFEEPHQYATGMLHVIVNGEQVLENGRHTGATPGRVVRGPGWDGCGDEIGTCCSAFVDPRELVAIGRQPERIELAICRTDIGLPISDNNRAGHTGRDRGGWKIPKEFTDGTHRANSRERIEQAACKVQNPVGNGWGNPHGKGIGPERLTDASISATVERIRAKGSLLPIERRVRIYETIRDRRGSAHICPLLRPPQDLANLLTTKTTAGRIHFHVIALPNENATVGNRELRPTAEFFYKRGTGGLANTSVIAAANGID